ncbi:AraC family transcriptional regulator [Flavobacterium rakeshii]|uniref:helix-turn-helix domain-containing protein n=1 Tax=Flavobacterium rakeshii TaxID=1038845 RepID=UPI002E7B3363|nr:AraC family transcriptional regulator [Flavobacterium rakeshii]MEE1896996.1 AraC family transcriptional regulator [Flavobacterium rakeshii]
MEYTRDRFPAEVHFYLGTDNELETDRVNCNGDFIFIFVRAGVFRVIIDGNKISCTSNELVVVLCRHYYQVLRYNRKTVCYFVKVKWEFITDLKMSGQFIELLVSKQSFTIIPDLIDAKILIRIMKLLHYYYETSVNPERFPLASFRAALSLLLFQVAWQRDTNVVATSFNRKEMLSIKFFKLLIQNYREQRTPGFYATKLCVTKGYLNKAIREVTGKTVSKCMAEVLISEVKYLLMSSPHSIETISEQLHFNSVGSFCRFFKRQTGITPTEYRKEYGK